MGRRGASGGCFAALLLTASCGTDTTRPSSIAGMGSDSGSQNLDGDAEATGGTSGGAANAPIAFDRSGCAARPASDCEGIRDRYGSNDGFDATPALSECSRFNSFDGCGELTFDFDSLGCVRSVSASEHLTDLRECLAGVLQGSRWTCLSGGTLRFEESCRTP
jgi:hypothetical protein